MDFPTLGELIKYFCLGIGIVLIVFAMALARWDAITEQKRMKEYIEKLIEEKNASDDSDS
jgi:hypothetical protein